ncbi:MAG: hypothetical protein ABI140_10685 [Jatrophihabitantaceae bacterium]
MFAVVELSAIAMPIALGTPRINQADLGTALELLSLSCAYSLFTLGWERARRHLLFGTTPEVTPDLLACWSFAAALMLPPLLAGAVIVGAAIAEWPAYNAAGGSRTLYKYVYGTSSVILAACVASLAEDLGRWIGPFSLVPAAVAWILTPALLLALGMAASGQSSGIRHCLHPGTYRIEVLTMAVATIEYVLHVTGWASLLWLSLPAAILFQRRFTHEELQRAERGGKLISKRAWRVIATEVVQGSPAAAVIRIDTDDPVAALSVAHVNAGCDIVAKHDDGLVALLVDCPGEQAEAVARRLRMALQSRNVAAEVSVAAKPRDGYSLDALLVVSEAELVVRKPSKPSTTA